MINVSDAFKQKLQDGEKVWQEVEITFPDGTTKTVKDEIMSGNNSFSDCAESSSFPIGCVVCKSMTLELDNTSDQWKNYNFYMAKVHAYLKMQTQVAAPVVTDELLDENYEPILDYSGNPILATKAATEDRVETIDKGVYTITTPEQYGEILNFTALDDMYKTNAAYTSNLVLPQTVISLIRDACETLDIPMGFSSMAHGNLIVNEIPDNMTFRQLFGWAAMLETANARLDSRGYLQFVKWNFLANPIELKDYIDMPTVSSDDIVITGIRVKNGDNSELYGKSGYVLDLENNLVGEADLAAVAAQIGDSIIGAKFRNFQGDMVFNPLLEFGDMAATYDRNMNKYLTPLTDVSYTINGKTTVKAQADDPIRGMSQFVSDGTKAIVEARRLVKIEKTEREKAVERLAGILASSGGLYMTEEAQDDGSIIYYMHNKPTLNESDIIWKLTAEAFAVSIDGGKTYPYGFAVTGELITRLLYAEGINATYINAGTLVVKDKNGKVIFMADMDSGSVRIDASYIQIGSSALDKTLDNMQGQIDGNIETWTGTDAPTLDNYPAKNWLTDDERSKHVGDVYYDSKNQGYRFRNDGSGYGWQMVKDTDITKALQDASEAKESAANAEKAAALARNMTLQLSNDMQTITSDADGNIPNFPTVATRATVMYGTQDITDDCSFTITKSDSVIGAWSDTTHTYNVTGLSADNGWVDIKATYLINLSVTKRFTLAKQKQGLQGIQGVGKDGKTTYLHIRYSPVQNPASAQMTTTPNGETEYIGTYSDFNGTPSTNPSDYTWAKFKGDQGVQGEKGEDGKSSYTWMRYATRPDGSDMSDSPDYVKLLDSAGNPILDSTGAQIYTVTQTTYLGLATNKDTPTESDNPADYVWSRFRGVDGYDGKDGAQGIQGPKGEDGKTQYTHLAYANSADGKTDFSVDNPNREYIGMYVDFEEIDSTDPTKYAWSLIKGAKGDEGTPGAPGDDGKTPYFHIAYADSSDGKTGFSVDDSVGKLYIGQYTDYEKADSTDPTKYSWTLIKGADGVPGRSYMLDSSATILKRESGDSITPNVVTFSSYYRDGDDTGRTAYVGRFVIEETSDGKTWKTVYTSASDETSVNYYTDYIFADSDGALVTDSDGSLIGVDSKDITGVRCSLYSPGGTTNLIGTVKLDVITEVTALTQEDILKLLTNDGEWKGIYKGADGELYISFSAAMGGLLKLGGKNNGNGVLHIYDTYGRIKATLNYNGLVVYNEPLNPDTTTSQSYTGLLFDGASIHPIEGKTNLLDEDEIVIVVDERGIFFSSLNDNGDPIFEANFEKLYVNYFECNNGGYVTFEKATITGDAEVGGNLKVSKKATITGGAEVGGTLNSKDINADGTVKAGRFRMNKELISSSGGNNVGVKAHEDSSSGSFASADYWYFYKVSSSSKRYKDIGGNISEADIDNWYKIEPVWAKYKDGYLMEGDENEGKYLPMFIAEDVEKCFPEAVTHERGQVEDWNYRMMIPAMFAMLKQQKSEIDDLKEDVKELRKIMKEMRGE